MDKSQEFSDRRKFMILTLNNKCREPWTPKELKKGKVISIKWRNRKEALSVLPLYEEKGWMISHEVMLDVTGRTLLIRMKHPPKPPK